MRTICSGARDFPRMLSIFGATGELCSANMKDQEEGEPKRTRVFDSSYVSYLLNALTKDMLSVVSVH